MISIRDIKLATGGSLSAGHAIDPEETVRRVVLDSRQVQPGDMFIAVRGERLDGHTYIPSAIQAGAKVVMLSAPPTSPPPYGVTFVQVQDTVRSLGDLGAYWRCRMPAKVVGITGSVGKTSTKEVLAAVLSSCYRTLRSEKSLNNELGLPLTLLSLRPEIQIAVLEMGGAYAMGEIAHLCSLAHPHTGVVTNVGYAHIGRMGTIERIAETKSELVRCLPPDGLAVLNRDDPFVRQMAQVAPCPVLWYGLADDSDVQADQVQSEALKGIQFRLRIRDRVFPNVKAPLLGRHSVHTVLAAAAVAHSEGMDDEAIIAALRGLESGVRLIVNRGVNGSTIIDDTYNANPTSVLAALNLLADLEGRKIAVLGDMAELGDYSGEGHRRVGARAAEVCDVLYTVGSLSREIASEALQLGLPSRSIHQFATVDEAVPVLSEQLREGDIVLLKGSRAMELDRLAAQLTVPEAE